MKQQLDSKKAAMLVRQAAALSAEEVRILQEERLRKLVAHAREHSPYLKEKYKDLPEDFSLADIPFSTRPEMVQHFREWVCDPAVTAEGIEDYLSDRDNISKQYLGKYAIASTSGTTAEPLRIVRDARHLAVHGALMSERYFHGSLLKDVEGIDNPFLKSCAIIPNTGAHSSYMSFLRMRKAFEDHGMADRALLIPVFAPTHEMVAALNAFRPEIIGCYPSTILLLAHEQMAGRLNIHPLYIGCSAEKLMEQDRAFISKAFSCPVNDNYCSTEGGEVAMLCSHGHLHVNSDWIIAEPVDCDGKPVPDGTPSEGVLITNLANLVQPVIRYYMSDSITMHSEPCACGLPLPYIEINGRMEDTLEFSHDGRTVQVAGTTLFLSAIDTDGCETAQIIQRSPADVEIRVLTFPGFDREAVKNEIRQKTRRFMDGSGLPYVNVTMSEELPVRTQGGKMRLAYKDF